MLELLFKSGCEYAGIIFPRCADQTEGKTKQACGNDPDDPCSVCHDNYGKAKNVPIDTKDYSDSEEWQSYEKEKRFHGFDFSATALRILIRDDAERD